MADALVSRWLTELGLSSLIPMLANQGIDAEAMAALSDAHFAALGISRIGDKAKLRYERIACPLLDSSHQSQFWVALFDRAD